MYCLAPIAITDAVLTASSLPETDYPTWSASTPYNNGNRVIADAPAGYPVPRLIYQAVGSVPSGNVPAGSIFDKDDNPTGRWIKVGAPNRWQAFDWRSSDRATAPGDITYQFTVPVLCNAVGLIHVSAGRVAVNVRNPAGVVIWTAEQDLVDTSAITDWWEWLAWQPVTQTRVVIDGVPGYPGHKVEVTIAGSAPSVGQIAIGRTTRLGTTLVGTEIGFEDYSRKSERDAFGHVDLIERDFSDLAAFRFAVPFHKLGYVTGYVAGRRAEPSLWYASPDAMHFGATVYGWPAGGIRTPLEGAGVHFATLEIEGLT